MVDNDQRTEVVCVGGVWVVGWLWCVFSGGWRELFNEVRLCGYLWYLKLISFCNLDVLR